VEGDSPRRAPSIPAFKQSAMDLAFFGSKEWTESQGEGFKNFISQQKGPVHTIEGIQIDQKLLGGVLSPNGWLNDEAINAYLSMLSWFAVGTNRKRTLAMNSFFMPTLVNQGAYDMRNYRYSNVSRWTRKHPKGIFSFDLVLVPVNHRNAHWYVLLKTNFD
jgi:Ulp1 family protease